MATPAYDLLERLACGPVDPSDADTNALDELRRVGYQVDETGGMLRLVTSVDVASRVELDRLLETDALGREVRCCVEVGSTNDVLLQAGREGAPHGTVALAEYQGVGRGRAGRRWHSPPNSGLWVSVLLHLDRVRAQAPWMLTLGAGAAAAAAVEQAAGFRPALKWPNDVLADGRKLGGILCESQDGLAVVGIGVNVHHEADDFPPDLQSVATSVRRVADRHVPRVRLLSDLLLGLETMLELDGRAIRERWLFYWADRGRKVVFEMQGEQREGTAEGLSEDGGLEVRTDDGLRVVYAGDVTPAG